MNTIGIEFRAFQKEKIKAWNIVKGMHTLGKTFHICGVVDQGICCKILLII